MTSRAETSTETVDVRDMIVVHTAMLREFRLLPALLRGTSGADTGRRALVAGHIRFLCDLLHHHHEGEDELLWPLLEQRAPATVQEWVEVMHDQHDRLDTLLTDVRRELDVWERSPDQLAADRLTELHAALVEHLDLEEREVLPVAAVTVTTREWHAIGEAAVAALPKPRLPLVFGMFMHEGDPQVLTDMLRTAPLVPRLLMPRIAPRVYARYARRVHGTATP